MSCLSYRCSLRCLATIVSLLWVVVAVVIVALAVAGAVAVAVGVGRVVVGGDLLVV